MNPKNPNADNIPKLRFPEFKGGWERKKLGEVSEFKVTNSFSRENLNYEIGKVKNIHYGDIHTKFQTLFDITKEEVPYINEEISISRISDDFYCKEGDLVFADASEDLNDVGKSIEIVNLNKEKLLSGLHTLLARPKDNYFSIGFNGYLLKSNNIRLQIQKEAQGSKVLSINVGRISKIELNFPTLPEQKRIASFFTVLDKKIAELKEKKSLLEQYKKGVMQKLFPSTGSGQAPELRFKPARSAGGDENGKEFPKWEKQKLGEIGETYSGLSGKTKEDFGEGKPYIQYKQIFDDSRIDVSRFELVKIAQNENQNKVQFGDVFFTVSSETPKEIGTASVLLDKIEELYLNSFCFGYRSNSLQILSPYFSRYLFRSELFRNEIVKLAQGSTRYNMSKVQLMKLEIQLPDINEQNKIANFLSAIDDKINRTEIQIQQTQHYKKGLLQKMFV